MKQLLKKLIPETSLLRLAYHRSKALVAALRYGFPARKLTVIGITGTDGKTTTVGMIAHILNANSITCGALSTAFFQIGKTVTVNPTQKTSPSPFIIQKFLRECVNAGCTHAVLECSSHGLLQGRISFTWPMVAGMTNISEEHLDYHGTMNEYLSAKSLLFIMLSQPSSMWYHKQREAWKGTKVLHYSDPSYKPFDSILTEKTIVYNREMQDVEERSGPPMNLWLEDIQVTHAGSTATLTWFSRRPSMVIRCPLILRIAGAFNLDNALCAIGCVKALQSPIELKKIAEALASFKGIPGRMERIDAGQSFTVYIDFTVTPQSYESTLSTLRTSLKPTGRLLVLTGSCGDRMKEKRPIVGKIVSSYADISVVTNEDPYTENPQTIIDEVWSGIDQKKTEAYKIFDRLDAIQFLLKKAQKNDIVIFCGKGSDTTMWVEHGQVPWNEKEIVSEELRRLGREGG